MKLKNSHLFLMILCCVAMVAVFLFLPKIIKGNYWYILLILVCPLLHFLMMKGMGHGEDKIAQGHKNTAKDKNTHNDNHGCH